MYIAILLENLSSLYEEDELVINKAAINNFYDVWTSIAPDGKSTIPYEQLSWFAASLDKPFKIPKPNNMKIIRMKIPRRRGGHVHVLDVMKAIVKRTLEKEGQLDSPDFDFIVKKMEVHFEGRRKTFKRPISKKNAEEAAAITIQRAFRAYLRKKELKNVVERTCFPSDASNYGNELCECSADKTQTLYPQNQEDVSNSNDVYPRIISNPSKDENSLTDENVSHTTNNIVCPSDIDIDSKKYVSGGKSFDSVQQQRKRKIVFVESAL